MDAVAGLDGLGDVGVEPGGDRLGRETDRRLTLDGRIDGRSGRLLRAGAYRRHIENHIRAGNTAPL
jgi:hypothetical protein